MAYAAGKTYAKSISAAKEASIKQTAAEKQSTGKTAKTSESEGKVHFDRKGRTFSEAQETGIKTMEILSKALGTEFYVFESYEKDGKRLYRDENGKEKAAPNGFYDPRTGSIHIDLNAGSGGRGTVLFTLSHELTHFIRQWSPTKFDALAEAVMNYVYEKKNVNVKELIQAQQAKAQQQGQNLTEDEAYEEVIADSMETILRDGNVLNELMEEVRKKDATLWEKIKQWFSDLAEHIRRTLDAYKGYDPDSYEGRAVASMEKYLEALEGFYADALSTAGENFRAAPKNEKSTAQEDGVKYSLNKNAKGELKKALYDTSYRNEVLLRDETPAIMLAQKGVKNLPMVMNASHIRENVFSESEAKKLGLRVGKGINYHGLGDTQFLKIIDGLDNVREAYRGTKNASDPSRRENYFLLVSEFTDQNGDTINVPVYINEHAQRNRVFIDVNKISTVFGRENFREYIKRQISEKNLVRIKNRSIPSSERSAPIADGYRKDTSKDSIRNPGGNVKEKFSLRDTVQEKAVKSLQTENDRLKEDVTRLKDLVKLQGKLTYRKLFSESYIVDTARSLKKLADAKSYKNKQTDRE